MRADAAHPNPDVAKRLARIYTLHRTEIDLRLGTSPYNDLLEKLGNPHKKLPPVAHIAGTNGKGSVLAFLRAMLEADGNRVHVYTSPHLLTFNERIRIAGTLITDAQLIDLYDRVDAANDGASITFFEFTTAMAFLAFAGHDADYVLLETGMGGRLDCTNVIENPVATAITKISFDHTEFLGNTLEQIAAEKAGIMKPGAPCVIGAQMYPDIAMPVFEAHAQKTGASLITGPAPGYPQPNLAGAHQIENAAVALHLANILGVSEGAKAHGVTHAQWPARLQHITQGSVAALMPPGWALWFDAAHNDSGALALAEQLRAWKRADPTTKTHLVLGLAADKDEKAFLDAFSGLYDTLTLVDLREARRPQTAAELGKKVKNLQLTNHYEKNSINEAVKALVVKYAPAPGRCVIAGSLYLYQQTV